MVITDTEGRIEYANGSFAAMSGYERDEVIGRLPSVLQRAADADQRHDEVWSVLHAGEVWRGEVWHGSVRQGQVW